MLYLTLIEYYRLHIPFPVVWYMSFVIAYIPIPPMSNALHFKYILTNFRTKFPNINLSLTGNMFQSKVVHNFPTASLIEQWKETHCSSLTGISLNRVIPYLVLMLARQFSVLGRAIIPFLLIPIFLWNQYSHYEFMDRGGLVWKLPVAVTMKLSNISLREIRHPLSHFENIFEMVLS